MTDHLLIVNLGPVQDFIASARRCQDLWFSSWLLSELSRVTAASIQAQAGDAALIFPGSLEGAPDSDQRPAVANKIVARLRAGLDPRTVADQARTRMDERLRGLAERAHGKIPPTAYFDAELREIARRQVEDLMEVQWVAVPLRDDGPGAYARAHAAAERLLSARKARARWSQVAPASEGGWGKGVPKSSLDGQRESALHEALYDALDGRPRKDERFPPLETQKAREKYFVRKRERLCGVGLLKRVGAEDDDDLGDERLQRTRPLFHSTSHVASAPLRTRVAVHRKGAEVDAYARLLFEKCEGGEKSARRHLTLRRAGGAVELKNPFDGEPGDRWVRGPIRTPVALGEERLDGSALYIAQLPAHLDELRPKFAEARPVERERVLAPLQQELRALLDALGLSEDDVPAYYATLLADGDSMGAALRRVGEAKGIEGHRKVSEALDAFSRSCRETVQAHAGSLIYAGGDDVLALLPLHTVMRCGRKLHDDFETIVGGAFKALVEGAAPTLSMGIGIAHHLDDMADARRLAHRAERRAKDFPGKDAMAVMVQMRSGGLLEVVDGFTSQPALDTRIEEWAKLLLAEVIPDKAAFELERAMAPLLDGGTKEERQALGGAARSLASRVLDRRRGDHGEQPMTDKVREQVDAYIPETRDKKGEPVNVALAVHALSHELQIARLLADALRVAFEAPKPKEGT